MQNHPTDRIESIISALKQAEAKRGYAKRDDLERASDVHHIKKHSDNFLSFCKEYNIKTFYGERLDYNDHKEQVTLIIKELYKSTDKAPKIRDVKSELKKRTGRKSIKLDYNNLLKEIGIPTNRSTKITRDHVIDLLLKYEEKNGFMPYAKTLKESIGIAPNSRIFRNHGGYQAFLIDNGLATEESINHGAITPIRMRGKDGYMYDSKIEAMVANFMMKNKIEYWPHIGLGTYRHQTNQLTIDFLVRYNKLYAIEIDGLGKLRRNISNMEEKQLRSNKNGWIWKVISRDKARYLCQQRNMEYWERLVS